MHDDAEHDHRDDHLDQLDEAVAERLQLDGEFGPDEAEDDAEDERQHDLAEQGAVGWFVTRSYHLYQLPLLSRKLRVVADWTVALFFRRDIAELGGLGRPRGLGDE